MVIWLAVEDVADIARAAPLVRVVLAGAREPLVGFIDVNLEAGSNSVQHSNPAED